jgi:hypothetical protein
MNKLHFEILASHAAENIFNFADFTSRAEDLFSNSENADALRRYQSAWFELEIVNATALAEWESEGRPTQWTEKWVAKYRSDALETLDLIRAASAELWELE